MSVCWSFHCVQFNRWRRKENWDVGWRSVRRANLVFSILNLGRRETGRSCRIHLKCSSTAWRGLTLSIEIDISLSAMSGWNEKPCMVLGSRRKPRDDWHSVSVCHAGYDSGGLGLRTVEKKLTLAFPDCQKGGIEITYDR
jgi:hypothetical protein